MRDYAGLTEVLRSENGNPPFTPAEVNLTELLAENANGVADEVQPILDDALSGPHLDADRVYQASLAAGSAWQAKAWPSTLEAKTGVLLSGAALVGAQEVGFAPLLSDLDRLRIVSGMVASARYSTNNYFNTQVMPALVDAVHAAVLSGRAGDGEQLRAIKAMLDRRLRSVPYWNLVANAASSRAYHYGFLKVAQAAGVTTIRYSATIDSLTSDMCIMLNGTTWRVGDLVLLADRITLARDVEDVKTITPWLKADDVRDFTPDQLLAAGVAIPPVHGNCRSRLVID